MVMLPEHPQAIGSAMRYQPAVTLWHGSRQHRWWPAVLAITLLIVGLSVPGLVVPTHAAQQQQSTQLLQGHIAVDKPIIHLGEIITVKGAGFTPRASIALHLHGPASSSLGRSIATIHVDSVGTFIDRIAIRSYPDIQAQLHHTVIVAAISLTQMKEKATGVTAAVQVDPRPGITITTHGSLAWTALFINGTAVTAQITQLSTDRYWVSYAGHLRRGPYNAYLKWRDTSGSGGSKVWTFYSGDPLARPGLLSTMPTLTLHPLAIRLGQSVAISGTNFTPHALVVLSIGGLNNGHPQPTSVSVADSLGQVIFHLHVTRYPSASSHSAAIMIEATASGPGVGDLPEVTAALLPVTG